MKKLLLGTIATIGLTITLGACSNNNSEKDSSESKIDESMLNQLQGDWNSNGSQPSIEFEDKTIKTEVAGTTDEYKLTEAKDNGFKGKKEDGDTIKGSVSGSSLTFKKSTGDSHNVEKK